MGVSSGPQLLCHPTIKKRNEGGSVVALLSLTTTPTPPPLLGDGGAGLGRGIGATIRAPDRSPCCFRSDVRDGLIAAERQYWGLLEFLVQTGVVGG